MLRIGSPATIFCFSPYLLLIASAMKWFQCFEVSICEHFDLHFKKSIEMNSYRFIKKFTRVFFRNDFCVTGDQFELCFTA